MKKRVMVVDDDEAIRTTVEHTLTAEGYDVCSAVDGQHALNLLDRIRFPDVIVTDLAMHPVDGRAFIGRLKGNPLLKNIPVVVITAEKDTRDLRGVVEQVVEKPFLVDDLLAAVGAAVGH